MARCRRQAAHRYRKAIEDFLIAAASGVDAVHLLLLDKNHPPSSLRNEVDVGGNVGPFLVSGVVNRPIFPYFSCLVTNTPGGSAAIHLQKSWLPLVPKGLGH